MTVGSRFVLPYQTVINNIGVPLPGAFLFFYASGTSTPLNTYSNVGLTVPNANPIQADDAGVFPNIFLSPKAYKVVLTDENLNQIWTADPVYGIGADVLSFSEITRIQIPSVIIDAGTTTFMVSGYYTPGDLGTSAVYTSQGATSIGPGAVQDQSGRWFILVLNGVAPVGWFGAKVDGATDDYPAVNAAIQALAVTGGIVTLPPGTIAMSSPVKPVTGVSIEGSGTEVTIIKNTGSGIDGFGIFVAGTLTGDYTTAITYAINTPTEGTKTLTTTAPADAGNLAAGYTIMASGPLHGTNFWYPTWTGTVASVDAVTGIITLTEPIPFGGTDWTLVQRVLTQPSNFKISDMTVLGGTNAAVEIQLVKNVIVDNIAVRPGSSGIVGSSLSIGTARNVILQNSRGEGVYFDLIGSFDCKYLDNTLNGGNMLVDGGTTDCLISGNVINGPTANGAASDGITLATTSQRNRLLGNVITNVPATHIGIVINGADITLQQGFNIVEGNTITGASTVGTYGISANSSSLNTINGNFISNVNIGIGIANHAVGQTAIGNTFSGVTTKYAVDATSSFRLPSAPTGLWLEMTAGAATPTVADGESFILTQAGAQDVTNYTDGVTGQNAYVFFADNNTTLKTGDLHLSGGIDYNPAAKTLMHFKNISGGWYEVSRVTVG